MLQESNYWASRMGAVQIFFLTPNRNMSAGKFVKWEREDIIFNVKWVEVRKIVERNCIVKRVIFFASFCWLWDFLLENLKLRKKNSDGVNWNVWRNIKTLYARIFSKKTNSKYEILNHSYFGPVFILGEFALGRFSQCFIVKSNFSEH